MLATLLELQRLKRLDRVGWTLRGQAPGAESVAAHTYGVLVCAMLLADAIKQRSTGETSVDVEKLLRLALLHDWAETRTGDLPRAAAHYFGGAARRTAEEAAFHDIVSSLDEKVAGNLESLYHDYEERASLEARLVKAADVIDLLAQALTFERAGARGLDEFWENASGYDFKLEGAAAEVVGEIIHELVSRRQTVLGASKS